MLFLSFVYFHIHLSSRICWNTWATHFTTIWFHSKMCLYMHFILHHIWKRCAAYFARQWLFFDLCLHISLEFLTRIRRPSGFTKYFSSVFICKDATKLWKKNKTSFLQKNIIYHCRYSNLRFRWDFSENPAHQENTVSKVKNFSWLKICNR